VSPWTARNATRRRPASGRVHGFRRFRCQECGRRFNERTGTALNRAQVPTDIVFLIVLWRFRMKLSLRDLAEILLLRGLVFSHEAIREWEARLAPRLTDALRKRRKGKAGRSSGRRSPLREPRELRTAADGSGYSAAPAGGVDRWLPSSAASGEPYGIRAISINYGRHFNRSVTVRCGHSRSAG
jgi:hypothetical protein